MTEKEKAAHADPALRPNIRLHDFELYLKKRRKIIARIPMDGLSVIRKESMLYELRLIEVYFLWKKDGVPVPRNFQQHLISTIEKEHE